MTNDEAYRLGLLDAVGDQDGPRGDLGMVLWIADERLLWENYVWGRFAGNRLLLDDGTSEKSA